MLETLVHLMTRHSTNHQPKIQEFTSFLVTLEKQSVKYPIQDISKFLQLRLLAQANSNGTESAGMSNSSMMSLADDMLAKKILNGKLKGPVAAASANDDSSDVPVTVGLELHAELKKFIWSLKVSAATPRNSSAAYNAESAAAATSLLPSNDNNVTDGNAERRTSNPSAATSPRVSLTSTIGDPIRNGLQGVCQALVEAVIEYTTISAAISDDKENLGKLINPKTSSASSDEKSPDKKEQSLKSNKEKKAGPLETPSKSSNNNNNSSLPFETPKKDRKARLAVTILVNQYLIEVITKIHPFLFFGRNTNEENKYPAPYKAVFSYFLSLNTVSGKTPLPPAQLLVAVKILIWICSLQSYTFSASTDASSSSPSGNNLNLSRVIYHPKCVEAWVNHLFPLLSQSNATYSAGGDVQKEDTTTDISLTFIKQALDSLSLLSASSTLKTSTPLLDLPVVNVDSFLNILTLVHPTMPPTISPAQQYQLQEIYSCFKRLIFASTTPLILTNPVDVILLKILTILRSTRNITSSTSSVKVTKELLALVTLLFVSRQPLLLEAGRKRLVSQVVADVWVERLEDFVPEFDLWLTYITQIVFNNIGKAGQRRRGLASKRRDSGVVIVETDHIVKRVQESGLLGTLKRMEAKIESLKRTTDGSALKKQLASLSMKVKAFKKLTTPPKTFFTSLFTGLLILFSIAILWFLAYALIYVQCDENHQCPLPFDPQRLILKVTSAFHQGTSTLLHRARPSISTMSLIFHDAKQQAADYYRMVIHPGYTNHILPLLEENVFIYTKDQEWIQIAYKSFLDISNFLLEKWAVWLRVVHAPFMEKVQRLTKHFLEVEVQNFYTSSFTFVDGSAFWLVEEGIPLFKEWAVKSQEFLSEKSEEGLALLLKYSKITRKLIEKYSIIAWALIHDYSIIAGKFFKKYSKIAWLLMRKYSAQGVKLVHQYAKLLRIIVNDGLENLGELAGDLNTSFWSNEQVRNIIGLPVVLQILDAYDLYAREWVDLTLNFLLQIILYLKEMVNELWKLVEGRESLTLMLNKVVEKINLLLAPLLRR